MSRKRTHEANEQDETSEKKRKIHHDAHTKCQAVRQWAKDFEWTTLDSVPVFGGEERNLFALGRQIERMLELVKFPKDVLVLTPEAKPHHTRPYIEMEFVLEATLLSELEKIARQMEPFGWWSPELVGKATNHCFESPVPDVWDLLWRHTFPQQVRKSALVQHHLAPHHQASTHGQNKWVKFTFLPERKGKQIDDYARTGPQRWTYITVECEHCVGNLVMHWCGLPRGVMRLVMEYFVFE